MERFHFAFCISILLISSKLVLADHPSVGLTTGSATPVTTTGAATLDKGQWSFSFQYEYVDNNSISDNRLIANAEANEDSDVHSISTVRQYSLNIATGITDNFTLAAQLPYIERTNIVEAHHDEDDGETEIEKLGDAEGIGDARLFGLYRFMKNEAKKHSTAAIFGIKIPTGNTNEKSPEEKYEAELQPGSGSWDPFVGIAYSKQLKNISFDTNATYQLVTEGTQDTDLGDFVGINAALSYRRESNHGHHNEHMHLQWDLILELNGEWREKEDIDGKTNDDSGGLIVFASPGVRVSSNKGMSAALAIGVPVIEDLHGLQSKPQYRLIANASFAF